MKSKCCVDVKTLQEIGQAADLLKIIAEENRLKILCVLKKGEKCVCEIWEQLNLPQNLASHHLKVLKEAGLINSHKDGLNVVYSLDKEMMKKFSLLLNNLL